MTVTAVGHDVVDLFDSQAAAHPDATAIAGADGTVSYAELSRRSMAVAQALRRHGTGGQEQVIGALYPRSADLLAAMLGILRTGAAVAPLDPGLPAARLSAAARAACVSCVITSPERVSDADLHVPVLVPGAAVDCTPWNVRRGPAALHQVAFTSGSEGSPKTVALPTGTSANVAQWMIDELGLGPGHRIAWSAGPGFSVANMEIWPALCSGGALVIVPEDAKASAATLREFFVRHHVGVAFVVAGMAERLSREPWPAPCPLRTLFVGGEKLRSVDEQVPFEIRTVYGTSETMITIASQPVAAAALPEGVGSAIPGADARVIRADLTRCEPGEPGELAFAGPDIARGYLHSPRETAEHFRPDPESAEPGGRIYPTSDLATATGGIISLLGRRDWQLNVNGLRVEPAEIELCLLGLDEVAEAAADVRESGGRQWLVAFVVTAEGLPLDPAVARAHLSAHLPLRSVPRIIVHVPSLPRTRNGKLNRTAVRQLPLPDSPGGGADPLNAKVARIWSEVLGADIDPDQSVTAAGGNSISAMQIATRCQDELGVAVSGAHVLMAPSLRDFSATFTAAGRTAAGPGGGPSRMPVAAELSTSQEGLWLASLIDPTHCAYNAHFALEFRAPVDQAALAFAVDRVQERHEILRARFPKDASGRPSILVELETQAALQTRRVLLDADTGLLEQIVRAFANRPYDLANGPLLRFCLLDCGEVGTHLVTAFHQMIVDGQSETLLRDEICTIYDAVLRTGTPPRLAAIPLSYIDLTRWRRDRLTEAALQESLATAAAELAGVQRLGSLRGSPPGGDEAPGGRVGSCLTREVVEALTLFTRDHSVTEFAVLLAVWRQVVADRTGMRDLLIGTPLSERDRPEAQTVVGPLVNTVPIRHPLGAQATWAELGKAEQIAVARAIDRGSLPFHRLSQALRTASSPRRAHSLELYFSLLSRTAPLPPATRHWEVDPRRPKFDLNLQWTHEGGDMRMWLEYDTRIVPEITANELVSAYLAAIRTACLNPAAPAGGLPRGTVGAGRDTSAPPQADGPGVITDPLQALIREAWAAVLNLGADRIGPHDDFFDLGGHSLLAADAADRLEEALGVPIDLINIFEYGSVRELAERIRLESPEVDVILDLNSGPGRPEAPRGARQVPPCGTEAVRAPMSLTQEQMWLSERLTSTPTMNVPMILRCSGDLDVGRLAEAFAKVVERQESLRTTFEVAGGTAAQVVAPSAPVDLPVTDLREIAVPGEREAAFQQAAEKLAEQPFVLTELPLYRTRIFRIADSEWRLVLIAHHSIFDGASLDILLRELVAYYEDLGAQLEPLTASYREYSAWQRARAESGAWDSLKAFWAQELSGSTPVAMPRSAQAEGRSGEGVVEVSSISGNTLQKLRALARTHRVSDFMVLLAAYAVLLWSVSGQRDLTIAAPSTRRSMPGAEGLIGFFVNMLPMRLRVEEEESFQRLLMRTRDVVLRAYAHQELPYSLILESGQRGVADVLNLPVNVGIAFYRAQRGVPMGDAVLDVGIRDYGAAFSDLEFYLLEYPGEIEVHAYGSRERVAPEMLRGYLDQFCAVLEALCRGGADQPCGRLRELADGTLAGDPPARHETDGSLT